MEELTQIIDRTDRPFIVKGIMTVKGALKARAAGAAGIVVSNHGGRVLDQCPATAEVQSEIADAVNGTMKVIVDGGIRSGVEYKALAMGADACDHQPDRLSPLCTEVRRPVWPAYIEKSAKS